MDFFHQIVALNENWHPGMHLLEGVKRVLVPVLLTLASDTKVTATLKLLLRKDCRFCLQLPSSNGDKLLGHSSSTVCGRLPH